MHSDDPQPQPERVPIHYVGDGGEFVVGLSTRETSWTDPATAAGAIETGLYAAGEADPNPEPQGGDPEAPDPTPEAPDPDPAAGEDPDDDAGDGEEQDA